MAGFPDSTRHTKESVRTRCNVLGVGGSSACPKEGAMTLQEVVLPLMLQARLEVKQALNIGPAVSAANGR
jgi:hypothetical protein